MLKLIIIGVLLCVICIMGVAIQVLSRKLCDARREIASWKLACSTYENERQSW
jgi:hypothetical protein